MTETSEYADAPLQPQVGFERRQIRQQKEGGHAQRTGSGVSLYRILWEAKERQVCVPLERWPAMSHEHRRVSETAPVT